MSYGIRLTKRVEKEIALLSNEDYARISKAISALADNPRPIGARKLKGYEVDWRIRVGRFRILYSVEDVVRIIEVYRITDRKEAYRGL